jgi:serine/threonine-protein kinase
VNREAQDERLSVPEPVIHPLDGKYRVLAQLGQGGTANVSLAVARGPSGFNKLVVLKAMKHALRTEPEFARMYMDEARLAARINHPNNVQTNEVFEFEGLPVLVMEYLEGQPLSSIVSRASALGAFSLLMHLKVISDVLSGLQYSHELTDYDGTPLGLVHRDVSPHNVFVTFDGQVKLLDFGIAKLSSSRVETDTGVIKGKLHYMPPEQVAGERLDRRADLYAVGVMLWEAAAGQKMWQGMSDATVMNKIVNGEITGLSEIGANIAPGLQRVIERSLAPDQDDRYAAAADLQKDLDEWIAGQGAPIKDREIGKAVEELFRTERATTRRLVEAQLHKVSNLSEVEFEKLSPVSLTMSGTLAAAPVSRTTKRDSESSAIGRAKSTLVAGTTAAVIAVGAVAAWQFYSEPQAPALDPSAQREMARVAPAATRSSVVTVRVTAFPATAKLFWDGELLPSNPMTRTHTLDVGSKHRLVARAEGYEAEVREVRLDQDIDVVLTLREKPREVAPEAEPLPAKKRPAKAEAPKPLATPAATCTPPYVIDHRGVKRYKTECL